MATRYVTLKDSNGDIIYPQSVIAQVANGEITGDLIASDTITSDKLKGLLTANTADTWVPVTTSTGEIQHRVIAPFNADGTIPTSAIADGAVTASKLDNTSSWVLIGQATGSGTGTFLNVSIPAAYGTGCFKVMAKFEMSSDGADNWVDLRCSTANGDTLNCVNGITVDDSGTIAYNGSYGQFNSYYIVNATDHAGWRCWNIEATSMTFGSNDPNFRNWLASSGNGHFYNNVTALNNVTAATPITNIKLITAGSAQASAILKVWGMIPQ